MATKLTYPKLLHVKLGMWSIKQKIHYKTGIAKDQIIMWGNSENTNIDFLIDLTQQQIDDVNAIMAHEDAQGPDTDLMVTGNSLILLDPYVWHQSNETETGIHHTIWYRESGSFPGRLDEVVIIPTDATHTAQRIVTKPQKNAIENAIVESFRWE